MQKINWKGVGNDILRTLKRKSPEILTGVGVGSMLTTIVLAVRATPEAMRRIETKKKEERHKKLTAVQTVQAAWKCYIPAGITGTVSIFCLIGASTLNGRRNATLATAASLVETSLREYRSKVVETIGEKKESSILDAVDRERVEKDPPSLNADGIPIINAPVGQIICYDATMGRWGCSDAHTLRNARDKLNYQMTHMIEPYVSLNEFYMEINWSPVDIGNAIGWNTDRGLIDLHISSALYKESIPYLTFSHNKLPDYDFDK